MTVKCLDCFLCCFIGIHFSPLDLFINFSLPRLPLIRPEPLVPFGDTLWLREFWDCWHQVISFGSCGRNLTHSTADLFKQVFKTANGWGMLIYY